ncbi:hypothetical protein BpHYR1_049936 [Brachionus plicatilis]|uniref:Uncharacterized protein n=1 Tax=Brachionus plicatilis TaxID=10195 RepID=A0A3M7RW72_BRAPC|nr:hypothetical protein BpHYR1_049936 [Brachionus plicatilis]
MIYNQSNSTTLNEVKKPRISDSGEGCFKALGNILRASSNGMQSVKLNKNKKRSKKLKKELEEEEDDHESLLKAN